MNTLRIFICAVLVCGVVAFDITDQFYLPPNEYITDIIVHDNYIYALLGVSNPATVYKIDVDSMKVLDRLQLPYYMQPYDPFLDKAENKLYIVALNSSSTSIYQILLTIDLNTFQVISSSNIYTLTNGCDQFFKAGPKFYCINQEQESCTISRIDAQTWTIEGKRRTLIMESDAITNFCPAQKSQYCDLTAMYASSSLVTPDNQYAIIGYDQIPYIVSLPDLSADRAPNSQIQPYKNQKISRANHEMCATPDMTMIFKHGYVPTSLVRTNVTSKIGNDVYYVEPGNRVTCCLVSPDSKYVFSGCADGSVRRADALASSFGTGYQTLYTLDSSIQGIRMLDDQQTVLVWTSHQMLKFNYNDQLQPVSPQKLGLQENFENAQGMTVDQEERFAYVYAYDRSSYPSPFSYIIKYDLQQRSIVQVANTTIPFRQNIEMFLNADQTQLIVFADYAYVLNTDDLSMEYSNKNAFIATDVDYFQDPTTSDVVFIVNGDKQTDQVVSYNIDTKAMIQCSVSRPFNQPFKHLIRGPNNQVMAITPVSSGQPTIALVDRTTCATKYLNFTLSPFLLNSGGAYYNGAYYLTAHYTPKYTQENYLLAYNLSTGLFSKVADIPLIQLDSRVSFEAGDSYVMAPAYASYVNLYKLNLQTYQLESLTLFAPPSASYYNSKTNNAYILSSTNPPSIVKISV